MLSSAFLADARRSVLRAESVPGGLAAVEGEEAEAGGECEETRTMLTGVDAAVVLDSAKIRRRFELEWPLGLLRGRWTFGSIFPRVGRPGG